MKSADSPMRGVDIPMYSKASASSETLGTKVSKRTCDQSNITEALNCHYVKVRENQERLDSLKGDGSRYHENLKQVEDRYENAKATVGNLTKRTETLRNERKDALKLQNENCKKRDDS